MMKRWSEKGPKNESSYSAGEANICERKSQKRENFMIPPPVSVHRGMMAERLEGGFGLECVNGYTPRVPTASLQRVPQLRL